MKKWTALFSLLLALLILPCALAEDAYVPGETAKQLISDSFSNGKIIKGDVKLRLDADPDAFELDEEDAELFNAIVPLLDSVSVGVGLGKTESGIRVEADACLAHAQGGQPVTVNAAANLDLYGVSLESDLIPGQKVTSKWETLMAMAGMNDSDISMLLMLRDMDWEAMLPQIIAMAESYVQMGLQYSQPYMDIIVNWAASLPMTLEEGPAPEGYPAGASASSITVTDEHIMSLISTLAQQLKTDTVVCGLIDMIIQEAYTGEGNPETTVQLCDEVIAYCTRPTSSGDHIKLTWGMSEHGMPVYGIAQLVSTETGIITLGMSCAPNAENNNDYTVSFEIADSGNAPLISLSCVGEAGEGLFTAQVEFAEGDTQIMGMEYALTTAAIEDVLPGQKIEQNISMVIDDGISPVQMIGSTTATSTMTIDGGEVFDEASSMDMYVDGMQVTTTALETLAVYPDTEGFVGTYSTLQTMPQMGIDAIGMDVHLSDKAYDPATTAALSEIAFETSSGDDIDALLDTIMTNGQYKLIAAMQALPTEVLNLLMDM